MEAAFLRVKHVHILAARERSQAQALRKRRPFEGTSHALRVCALRLQTFHVSSDSTPLSASHP